MSGLGDFAYAMRFRDLITSIAENVVTNMRPEPRIGRIVEFQQGSQYAKVVTAEAEDAPITIKVSYPENSPSALDQLVEFVGKPGSYRMTRILTGQGYLKNPKLFNFEYMGGVTQDVSGGIFAAGIAGLPSVGNTYRMVDCWNVSSGDLSDGRGFVELTTSVLVNASSQKTYKFFVDNLTEETDISNWKVLVPCLDAGTSSTVDYDIEILNEGPLFHLRWRRKISGNPYLPVGLTWSMHIWGDGWKTNDDLSVTEEISSFPTAGYGDVPGGNDEQDSSGYVKGPFYDSPKYSLQDRIQQNMMGGSTTTWSGGNFKWTERFRSTIGVCEFTSVGYINIDMPGLGTTITHHGVPGSATQAVSASGILMSSGGMTRSVLYYDPPLRSAGGSDPARFHLVGTNTFFNVPSHWVMVASYDSSFANTLRLGTGRVIP